MRKTESTGNVIPLRDATQASMIDPIVQADDHPAARRRERERCEAILSSDAGHALPKVAQAIAFNTTLSRGEASRLIRALASPESLPFAHLRPTGRHLHLVGK